MHLVKLTIEKRIGFPSFRAQRIKLGAVVYQVPVYFVAVGKVIGDCAINLLKRERRIRLPDAFR